MKRTELPRAEALCARYLDKKQPVLAAVSGGLDSMCLLHFLRAEGYDVSCAHFNHRLRGGEALRGRAFPLQRSPAGQAARAGMQEPFRPAAPSGG